MRSLDTELDHQSAIIRISRTLPCSSAACAGALILVARVRMATLRAAVLENGAIRRCIRFAGFHVAALSVAIGNCALRGFGDWRGSVVSVQYVGGFALR